MTHRTSQAPSDNALWWRSAVTYQIYLRSFADASGDGLGDIAGIRKRLGHLAGLGVDAVWLNPWYPSPQADGGYDVADYRSIEPTFGTLREAELLIEEAHAIGLKVLLDIVPNHTSDEHPWFREALAARPGSPERNRYVFRPGRGDDGQLPPNDWWATFGGSAWERVTEADGAPGEWYLHLFDVKQPDLNWENPEVRQEFRDILRFWFDRGADGFRIDVAHGLSKDLALPDLGEERSKVMGVPDRPDHPHWDRPEVHEIFREWRKVAQEYTPEKIFVAEAWVYSPDRLQPYLRSDELHTAFDFDFLRTQWDAQALRTCVETSLSLLDEVGAPVLWVLSNHDVPRHVTRLGRTSIDPQDPLRRTTGPVDLELGRRRARALLMFELTLPGGVYLYQGEELGLEEIDDLPEEALQDPTWRRSGFTVRGRDGCRVPVPWSSAGPSLGFSDADPWLPMPAHWRELAVDRQETDPASMLWLYRNALRLRKEIPALGAGDGALPHWHDLGREVLAYSREPGFTCVVNTGRDPVRVPDGQPVLTSVPLAEGEPLPGNAAIWLLH
ncbi:MAG: alpha-glucosidase [Actinomycetota bacterium]|nr:alpha-glucosidase [Actinomycetota bacterium]